LVEVRAQAEKGFQVDVDDDLLAYAAEQFGTPAYVYDLRVPVARYLVLRSALPAEARLCYSLKANGHPAIVRCLADAGCGADAGSEGELATAAGAGVARDQTIFTGPAKTPGVLRSLERRPVGIVVVESMHEARRLGQQCARNGAAQDVLVRINPARQLIEEGIALGAPSSKFGLDEECAGDGLAEVAAIRGLRLRGIHVNRASNVLSADAWLAGAEDSVAIARRLADAGLPLEIVDLGGGLGVAYDGEEPFDLRRFADGLANLATSGFGLLLEVGRWLVAEAGWYLTCVLDVRVSRGQAWVVSDGGIHHLYRPLLSHANRTMRILHPGTRALRRVNVVGCLSTPTDVLASDVDLLDPRPGDIIAVPRCGAYGFSHSLQPFGMHPLPGEIVFDGTQLRLAARRVAAITGG
jgi:diaminopimelate decarboxylase